MTMPGNRIPRPLRPLLRHVMASLLLAVSILAVPLAAVAQRDPEYAEARASGKIGEKIDGYLGFVTPPAAELRRLVENINIKRRAVYAEKARELNATVEEYALTSGCLLIAHTLPGERYQGPDGAWHVRADTAPLRDPRCP